MPLAEQAQLAVNLNLRGNFRQGMGQAQRTLRGFSNEANRTQGRLGGLQARLRSPELRNGLLQGVGLSGGLIGFQLVGTAVSEAINYMGEANEAASDFTEAASKVDAVFEESAPTVRRWASTLDASFGISERAALKSAGTFGNFLVALGQTEAGAADMSTAIVELAGDLSSFNNQDVTEVLTALQSGLAGESEPVRRLGIDISAARVEALLLGQGIEKVNGEYTQAQKVVGRYLAIMEDTEKAQGDAARTADAQAGKQRQLNKNVDDLRVTVGQFVEGPMTDFTGLLVDGTGYAIDLAEGIRRVADVLPDLQRGAQDAFDPLDDLLGRDVDNDLANLGRIFGTAGFALVTDHTENATKAVGDFIDTGDALPGIFGDWQRDLQGIERDLFGTTEAVMDNRLEVVRASAGYQRQAEVVEDVAEVQSEATVTVNRFGRAVAGVTDDLFASARAMSRANKQLADFRDNADDIAETRSLQKINAELAKQQRLQRRAAQAGRVREFARRESIINELLEEKKLRQEGQRALRQYLRRSKQQTAAQRLVKNEIADTREEARKLLRQTRRRYDIDVTVDDRQLADALSQARALGTALNTLGGNIFGTLKGSLTGRRKDAAHGNTYYSGDFGYVGEHGVERIRNVNGITTITPIGGSRPAAPAAMPLSVAVQMSARSAERSTAKARRTNRARANAA